MTELPPLRPHFEAIMSAVYEHARLTSVRDAEGCGRQFLVVQEAFAAFEDAARSEALEEAAKLAVIPPDAVIELKKPLEQCGPLDCMRAVTEHIASAIRNLKTKEG